MRAGNVLFTADSAVMNDPEAHGGHPYTDLGMLERFGTPFYDDIAVPKALAEIHTTVRAGNKALAEGSADEAR